MDSKPGVVAVQASAALATAMGVGRFVYTPILPLMHDQVPLTSAQTSALASLNYLGYLIGSLVAAVAPRQVARGWLYRLALVIVIASLAAMPLASATPVPQMLAWSVIRLTVGIASALVFMQAAQSAMHVLIGPYAGRLGWVYGGVGGGIAASGLLVAWWPPAHEWTQAWWGSAVLAAALTLVAWTLPLPKLSEHDGPRTHKARRQLRLLTVAYTIEGAGYILAGTFLVAAVQRTPGPAAQLAWVFVGLAAVPSCIVWARATLRFHRRDLVIAALLIQAVGMALPALTAHPLAAVAGAICFGGTFLGIATLSLSMARAYDPLRSAAVLTTGYSIGQMVAPIAVTPLLGGGYQLTLLVGGALALLSAAIMTTLNREPEGVIR